MRPTRQPTATTTPPALRAPRLRLHRLRGWLLMRTGRAAGDDSGWGMECALPWLAGSPKLPR